MGTERFQRILKPTADLSYSILDTVKIIKLFNNVQMYDDRIKCVLYVENVLTGKDLGVSLNK